MQSKSKKRIRVKRRWFALPEEWADRLQKIADNNQRTKVGQMKSWILREEKELPVIKM